MREELRTVSEVVAALGGNQAVMALTGSKHGSAVSNWKKIGKFPAKTHKIVKDALRKRSLSAPDDLWGIIHG
jgi:hypothetical protein